MLTLSVKQMTAIGACVAFAFIPSSTESVAITPYDKIEQMSFLDPLLGSILRTMIKALQRNL